MVVYVILDKRGYEADDASIIGVYSSEEKAMEAQKQVLNKINSLPHNIWKDGTFRFDELDFQIDEIELDVTEFEI